MKILFFGSNEFSLPFLKWFEGKKEHQVVGVITTPPAPKGRGRHVEPTCVETYAKKKGFELFAPQKLKDAEFLQKVADLKPEALLVASYGKFLPDSLLRLTGYPLNIHPSLLPKYRGPSPILAPLLEGDSKTGVTLMFMTEKMDAGDLLHQKSFSLSSTLTGGELEERLVQTGLEILKEFFELVKENKLKPKKQQNGQASYTQKLKKEDTEFHWTDSISLIDRKVRAFSPKPKAFFVFRKNKVFLEGGELVQQNNQETKEPVLNRLDKSERTIELKLPDGLYKIKKVLPEGRKLIPAYDFVQGLRLKIGDVFK